MATLPELPNVVKLSLYVTRILGQNPSKFTLQGTNSYLIHHPSSPSLFLIDTTGPSSSAPLSPIAEQTYFSSLRSAILAHPTQPARVTDLILTHWHGDHVQCVGGVVKMLGELAGGEKTGLRVWKLPTSGQGEWKGEDGKDEETEASLRGVTAGVLELTAEGKAVRPLVAGQRFEISPPSRPASSTGEDNPSSSSVELEIIHTPGHTSDSICLALSLVPHPSSPLTSPPPPPLALFTADTVLGHSTAVFSSLSHYLRSLSSLISRLEKTPGRVPIYPGHGEVVEDGLAKVREYKTHREEREKQVVAALREVEEGKTVTASELTDQIYRTSIPASLKPAATHGLLLHLAKLQEELRVDRIDGEALDEAELAGGGGGEVAIPRGWNDGWRWAAKGEESL